MSNVPSNTSENNPSILQSIGKTLAIPFIALFNKIDRYAERAGIIYYYHQHYISGKLSPSSKYYQKYQDAVLKNKMGEKRFHKLLKIYSKFLRKENDLDFIDKEKISALFFNPQNYVVCTKSEYQKQLAKIKQDFQKQFEEAFQKREKEFKESLIQQLLPFTTSDKEASHLSDSFKQKDMHGIKYYAQRKKMEELEERERKIDLREEKLNVQNERIGLKSDKLDLNQAQLEIQKEKLSVQELVFNNERKLFAIEMQTRDLEHKIKMSELLDLSLDLKRKSYNIERFKKEFEIMQGLHDLEMRNREQVLTHGQQMLELQEQGLENEMTLKEAEFVRQQNKNNELAIDIEEKLLQLRENDFTQRSRDILLNIKEKHFDLKKEYFDLDLKEQDMNNKLHEQQMSILNEKAYLEQKGLRMEEERERTLFKLYNTELNNERLKFENSRLIQDLKSNHKY